MSKRRWKKRGACATISFALVCLICLDGVRAQSSSPSLSSPVLNTLTKETATNAPEDVVDEIVEDDPLGHAEVTRKELNEVLRKVIDRLPEFSCDIVPRLALL